MQEHDEKWLEPLLRNYQIFPQRIKKKGNVYQIITRDYTYALKGMKNRPRLDLMRLFQWLNIQGFFQHVSILPDRYGRYYQMVNGTIYYLMPWIQENEERRSNKHRKMFSELAHLHLTTVKIIPVTDEMIQSHYENVRTRWQREEEFLLRFLEQCERKVYMSPFEWRYVLYYHEIRSAYQFAYVSLESWQEELLENKKARTCMVHGNLHPDHYLIDKRGYGYFINFEKSRTASPISDLLPYLARSLRTFPEPEGDEIAWLDAYQQTFQLTTAEKYLLQSYLAHPESIMNIIQAYQNKRRNNHELEYTKKIEQFYWSLKNRERFIRNMIEASEEMERNEQ